MKTKFSALMFAAVALMAFPLDAFADGRELATKKITELNTLSAGSIAAGDFVPVYDASAKKMVKVDATALPLGGTFTGAVVGTTGTFSSTLGLAGAVTIDDGSGASPSVTLQDGTDETAVFSKVDAGFLTLTTDATDGLNVLTGNLKVGNGTPGVTLNGEDAYIEGTLEVDGTTQFDGNVTVGANSFTTTGALSVDGVTVNKAALSLPGRATISICGDAVTVNNNTVYYGPSQVVAAGGAMTCNIAAAGNTTEATADAPAFDAKAFQILSMDCHLTDPGGTATFTTRSAAAATTPSMTCAIADNGNDCFTNAGTTTAIASGATLAIAVSSGTDLPTGQFVCNLRVAY